MNISSEINYRISCSARNPGSTVKRGKDIIDLDRYIDNVARERLEDLAAFVDAIDELPTSHTIQYLEVTQQIVEEFIDLDFAVRSAEGFLLTYEDQ